MTETRCDKIDAFLDGDLDDVERETFKVHLDVCSECSAIVTHESAIGEALQDFAETLQPARRIQLAAPASVATRHRRNVWLTVLELSAVLLIGVGIWQAMGTSVPEPTDVVSKPIVAAQEDAPERDKATVEEELKQKESELALLRSIVGAADSPENSLAAIECVAQGKLTKEQRKEIEDLQNQLFAISAKRSELLHQFGPQHPTAKQLGAQVSQLQKHLIKLLRQAGATEQGNKPVVKTLDETLALEAAQESMLLELQRLKVEQLGEDHPQVKAVNDQLEKLQRMMRERKSQELKPGPDGDLEARNSNLEGASLPASRAAEFKQALSLILQRDKYVKEFSENHPVVKAFDAEIEELHKESQRRWQKRRERMRQLEQENRDADAESATNTINLILRRYETDIEALQKELSELVEADQVGP